MLSQRSVKLRQDVVCRFDIRCFSEGPRRGASQRLPTSPCALRAYSDSAPKKERLIKRDIVLALLWARSPAPRAPPSTTPEMITLAVHVAWQSLWFRERGERLALPPSERFSFPHPTPTMSNERGHAFKKPVVHIFIQTNNETVLCYDYYDKRS